MQFQGKVALITGAAVGIGRATALRFAEEGADVILFDLNAEKLEQVRKETEASGVRALTAVVDVSDETAVCRAVAEAEKAFGKIDILINNAAVWRCWQPFWETPTEEWRKYLDVNVMGTVYCTRAVHHPKRQFDH